MGGFCLRLFPLTPKLLCIKAPIHYTCPVLGTMLPGYLDFVRYPGEFCLRLFPLTPKLLCIKAPIHYTCPVLGTMLPGYLDFVRYRGEFCLRLNTLAALYQAQGR